MAETYKEWLLSEAEHLKFSKWMATIREVHTGTEDVRNDTIHWTPLTKPLSDSVVSLFTTGGVHLRTDEPFDIDSAHGDWTYRQIPMDINTADLTITHSHYSHGEADRDVNCMFPLDRLRELSDQGVIGGMASQAYSIMGFNPDPKHLMEQTAPALAQAYKDSGADVVFMTCG